MLKQNIGLQFISNACERHINLLFLENRKSIPYFLSSKKTFQICNLPDFTFNVGNLNNKTTSPYGIMLILRLCSLQ